MNDFLFDLQRFDDTYTIPNTGESVECTGTGSIEFSVVNGTTTIKTYTMTLNGKANISADEAGNLSLEITEGYAEKLRIKDDATTAVSFTLLSGLYNGVGVDVTPDVTLGKTDFTLKFNINRVGYLNLNLNDQTLTISIYASYTYIDPVITIGDFSYKVNKKTNETLDMSLSEDGKYISFNVTGGKTFTHEGKTINVNEEIKYKYNDVEETYTIPDGETVTLTNDTDGNFYISGLDVGESFTINNPNDDSLSVTYTMRSNKKLIAERNGVKKLWNGDVIESTTLISRSQLDYDDEASFIGGYLEITGGRTEGATFSFSSEEVSSTLSALKTNGRVLIVDSSDRDINYYDETNVTDLTYGTIQKVSDTHFILEKNSAYYPLNSISIPSGYTVDIDKDFANVPITFAENTKFTSQDISSDFFSVMADNSGAVSVGGSNFVSLESGSLKTADSNQSLATGNYTISGYKDNDTNVTTPDGITFSDSNIIGELDTSESFSVTSSEGTVEYLLVKAGLKSKIINKKDEAEYRLHTEYKPSGSETGINVSLEGLGEGDLIIVPENKVLEIGKTNTQTAVVFDDESELEYGYASLGAASVTSGMNYTLSPLSDGDTFRLGISTISLTGGETTIYQSLVSANGSNVTIITDGTAPSTGTGATFLVTASSGDTFTVSRGDRDYPTITNATAITLLKGGITATTSSATQTITLGTTAHTVTFAADSADMRIELNSDGATFTVTAIDSDGSGTYTGGKFTFNGEEYNVSVSDSGMTFTLNPTDNAVTIGGLSSSDNDVLIYGGNTYSVKGAGFIKTISSGTTPSLWANTNSTVLASDLANLANWTALTTVDSDTSKVTIVSGSPTLSTLIDNGFSTTYGGLRKEDGVFYLTKDSNVKGTLEGISLASGVNNVSLQGTSSSSNFLGVSIETANSTKFQVNAANNNTYQVSISGNNTSLNGATSAELITGSLTADSNISSGVVVDSDTVIVGDEVTLINGSADNDASIAGLSKAEKFSISGSGNYTLAGAGLINSNNQLMRGKKPASELDELTFAISDIKSNDNWLGMIPAKDTLTIGTTRGTSLVVDDTSAPESLFGELTYINGSGYSLTGGDDYDAWNENYAIQISNSIVSLSNNFSVTSSFQGSLSGANFTITSLQSGANLFTVTDARSTGASLSNISAINQTAGLIAQSGINSISVGNNTIYSGNGLDINVSVSNGNATLSDLDRDETFNIADGSGSTAYSINNLGIVSGDKLFKENSLAAADNLSADISKLADSDNWIYVATINDNLFYVPPTSESVTSSWLILDTDNAKAYATLTKDSDNNYSIQKGQSSWETWSSNDTIQVGDGRTLSLSGDFAGKNISLESSGAVFTVKESSAYTVTDNSVGSIGGGAKTITQTAGTIALSSSDQSIIAGDGSSKHSISSANGDITVYVNDGKATLGALGTSDSVKVDGTTYALLSNGRLQRNDNAIWSGDTIRTNNTGSIAADSLTSADNWYGAITTDSDGNLTIGSAAAAVLETITSAFVVDPSDSTKIYGTLTDDYNLKRESTANATVKSVTFTENIPVSLDSTFANISLKAGSNEFTATRATGGFQVNHDSSGWIVNDAQIVSLQSGTLILSSLNSAQTIRADGQSVMSASESVNVNYDGSTVLINDIETPGESLKINSDNYSLIAGDGFEVSISGSGDSLTTVGDIEKGDEFQIGGNTFTYAEAGLTKTDSLGNSYLLINIHPDNNQLTLAELKGSDAWLGTYPVENENIVISTSIAGSAILVDDVDDPKKTYGQIIRDNGAYTLTKDATSSDFTNPTLITAAESVIATIDAVFNNISVTSDNATRIIVSDSSGGNHTISGTIDRFLPASMIFTPSATNGDTFAVDGTNYKMEGAGLTQTDDDKIWTEAGIATYSLPAADSSWSNMITLTAAGVLDFTGETVEDGSNVIVDNTVSTRWASLNYGNSIYSLNAFNGNVIGTIQTANGNATFATDFATTFETGNGTYKINDQTYRGNGLEVAATNKKTSTLLNGTVIISANESVKPSTSVAISVSGGDSITAEAANGLWQNLGALNGGDTFIIDGTTYQVYDPNTLVKLDSNGELEYIYLDSLTGGAISYSSLTSDDNYNYAVQLDGNNQLDLTTRLSNTPAIVIKKDDPSTRIGSLTYSVSDNAYTLTSTPGGYISDLAAVSLSSAVNTFNTDEEVTVKTAGTATFKINSKSFVANNALTIATETDDAILTGGSVTLSKNYPTVNTRYNNIDETITLTTGTINVSVSDDNVTISDINTGEAFTVKDDSGTITTYTMTAIGLVNGNSQLNVMDSGKITTANLSGDDWKAIVAAPSGVLTIDSLIADDAFVVDDTSNPTIKYGEITNSKNVYTLSQEDSDPYFNGININGVKAVLPITATEISIAITNGPTFEVLGATDPFTIDATTSKVGISDEVTAIELTAGTLQEAPENLSITASGNTIKMTSGTMSVGIDAEKGVFIGSLNDYETFTLNGTNYIMTGVGLLDTVNNKLSAIENNTYYLDTDTFKRIIAASGSTLNLTNETTNGEAGVYDSITNPTTHMADLKIQSSGETFTLTQADGGISTITLGENKTLTTDFAATVNASGTTTVNGNTYAGIGSLTIDAKSGTSTLQQGTIILNSTNPSAKATSDTNELSVTNGSIRATASDGKFTNLTRLNAGDIFKFDKTYTQSNIGLLSEDGLINTGVTSSVTVANLSGSDWQTILETSDGALTEFWQQI